MQPYMLRGQFDFIIGQALVDTNIALALLADPVGTSRSLGLCEMDVSFLADIREKDLVAFARTLARRLSHVSGSELAHEQPQLTERMMRASGE
jgi:hypothetical protein